MNYPESVTKPVQKMFDELEKFFPGISISLKDRMTMY